MSEYTIYLKDDELDEDEFEDIKYESEINPVHHVALVKGEIDPAKEILVRGQPLLVHLLFLQSGEIHVRVL